jgi:hypothetical protein
MCRATRSYVDLTIVDFDVKDEYYKLMEKHPELKEYKTIQTNKGFHMTLKQQPTLLVSIKE